MADIEMINEKEVMQMMHVSSRMTTLYMILCKCLFSEVTVQAVTELDNKAAHRHTPVPQRHRPFL
ncbi:hypothetical protein WP8S18E06_17390 [Klebsiella sp. WP8-S18-ESBL-06]|nr:hypothetical protein WP8S18E06_17390 [Klebsiella sp. WP8-S18-ESBL-06]